MVGRIVAGVLGAVILTGTALVLGYRAYQAYLEWLVAGTRKSATDVAPSGAQHD